MQEEKIQKREYKKKNDFKINIIFNEKGETLEKIIERAFENYCLKKNWNKIMVLNEIIWYNENKEYQYYLIYFYSKKEGKNELYNNE